MRRTVSCCKDCPDRILHCHSTCEKYIAEKEENLKEKRRAMKGYAMDRIVESTLIDNKTKIKKLSRR